MTITYAIWQGSRLVAHERIANSAQQIDSIIDELNESKLAKKIPFSAQIYKIEG